MFTLRFDMRAPDFGAPAVELYSAAAGHVRVGGDTRLHRRSAV